MRITAPVPAFNILHVFDPGGTTGYAKFRFNTARTKLTIVEANQFPTWRDLDTIITGRGNSAILYEDFKLLTMSAILVPVKVIGVIEYLAKLNHVPTYTQIPAERKVAESLCPDIVNYFPYHIKDAVMHGVVFAVKHKLIAPQNIEIGKEFAHGTIRFTRIQSIRAQG